MNNIEKFQGLLQRYVVLMELLNANNENHSDEKKEQKQAINEADEVLNDSNSSEEEKNSAKLKKETAQNNLEVLKASLLIKDDLEKLLSKESFEHFQRALDENYFGDLIKEDENNNIIIEIKSGIGHKGDAIQNYIKGYDNFPPFGSIKITANPGNNDGQYRNVNGNYLHWELTGQNLVAVWGKRNNKDNKDVDTITDIKRIKAGDPNNAIQTLSISDIFNQQGSNNNLENLFNVYRTLSTNLDLIEKHKNIVYTGAPGTGKTYLAKEMAAYLTHGISYNHLTKDKKKQIGFVQFHPSYDYSDFVEGLRPVETPKGKKTEISFHLTDGIFKQFCEEALKQGYGNVVNGKTEFNYDEANILRPNENCPKYVFIIDEINRGELSKIFGELFYSIDKGYRGVSGAVRTQYANLTTTPNSFDLALGLDAKNDKGNLGHFFIPENVYIIGTMNDIDRSVEPMDFAVRRRFVWLSVLPEERTDMWRFDASGKKDNWHEEALMRMNNINKVISQIETLGENYCIGPAYFLEPALKDDDKIAIGDLWHLRLNPLISEYLRVLPKMEAEQYKNLILKALEYKEEIKGGTLDDIKKVLYPRSSNE